MSKSGVYSELENIRQNYATSPENYTLPYKSQIEIDGCIFEINVWSDRHLNEEIIIFSASKSGLLIEQVNCLGLKVSEPSSVFLSDEELWEIGIP